MKIAFIVSSLEPGRDGVGDYTRRLAAELIQQGHECRLIALNEKGKAKVKSKTSGVRCHNGQDSLADSQHSDRASALRPLTSGFMDTQTSEGTPVECLRLPETLSWPERTALARQWVEEYKPDWVSLQFVPFGFHPKGLCFGLGKTLATINPERPWHIMFHELWLGLARSSSIKHRVWGALQRRLILQLVNTLRPRVVHTQAQPYQVTLQAAGVSAAILPLFGNIPKAKGDAWGEILQPLLSQNFGKPVSREQVYLAGVFGGIHLEWNARDAVEALLPLVQRANQRLVLVLMGRNHLSSEMLAALRDKLKDHVVVLDLGERTNAEISKLLQTLDLGLATTPLQLIEKSGSVAAMLEHGLPALVTRDDWQLIGRQTEDATASPQNLSSLILTRTSDLASVKVVSSTTSQIVRTSRKLTATLEANR